MKTSYAFLFMGLGAALMLAVATGVVTAIHWMVS